MIKYDEKRGVWIVQYSERHKQSRRVKTLRRVAKSEAEAKRLKRTLKERVRELNRSAGGADMSWPNLLNMFYADIEGRDYSRATVENYRTCLDAHTRERWSHRKVSIISSQEIRDLIRHDLAEKSRSHQKSMLKFIRGVFNYAVESRFIDRSPVSKMQFRVGTKFKPVLNAEQAAFFLTKAAEYGYEWHPVWMCAVYLGCRNEELFPFRWHNVDLGTRQIRIVETWTKKNGLQDLTKNEEDRLIEIPAELHPTLRKLKQSHENFPYVLPRIAEWEAGRQAEALRIFLTGIGLPQVNFHALRATWATWATIMLSKGVELAKVMKLGGWKCIKTLNEHYLRQAGIDIKGATEKMVLGLNQKIS